MQEAASEKNGYPDTGNNQRKMMPSGKSVKMFLSINEIMNFLDNHPSENRMEFTKLKVACKYASIGWGCACC